MLAKFRPRATYANVAATVALLMGLTGFAFAAIPGPDGVIHACYQKKKGGLRVLDAGRKCLKSEKPIAWNQTGPQGKGEKGEPGPTASGYAQEQNLGSSTTGSSEAVAIALSGSGGSGPLAVGFNARLQVQGIVSVTMSNTAEEGDYLGTSCKPQVAAVGSAFSDIGPSSYTRLIQGDPQGGSADGTVDVVGAVNVSPGTYDARIVCVVSGGGVHNGSTANIIAGDAIAATAIAR